MNKLVLYLSMLLLSGSVLAQDSLSTICEVDYFNATRYAGGRNIARTPNGNVVVVFEPASNYTNGSMDIHYAIYNSIFGSWDVAKLSNSPENATGIPAIIAHPDSEIAYAVWKELASDGKRNAMFSKLTFIDAFTHQWSAPVVADNIDNNTGVITVDIASDGSIFNLFSIWNDPAVFDANIYSSRSTDGGVTWNTYNLTSEFPTPNSLPINYLDVNLAPGRNGNMYACWEDKPTEITNTYELLFSEYSKGTDSWSKPEIISPLFDGDKSTIKYVDGCTLRPEAQSVYNMGPADYALAGKSAVMYYDNGTSKVLSSWFNPYYMKPDEDWTKHLSEVVSFFGLTANDSLLVVDDDNRYNNEWVVTNALDSVGINYSVHDCGDVGGLPNNIPTADEMDNYAMVIWFCGSDGKDIAFWNAAEEDNPELISYLNSAGSKLWVLGEDVLYDRYGGAPDAFSAGDFPYDYLGIASYDVQAYADDEKQGVSELDLVTDNGLTVSTVDPIGWGAGGTRQGEPSIATDAAHTLHLVYHDENGDHIMYKQYDGTNWSEPVQIDASADTVYVERPNIAVDPNLGVYITWVQATGMYQIEDKNWKVYNVFYATSPDGGQTWNAPVQMSNATETNLESYSVKNATIGKQVRPAIEGVFEGGADVVWTQYDPASSMGYYIMYGRIPYVGTLTGIEETGPAVACRFKLLPNYPNPFNPVTTIGYQLAAQSQVTLSVYNVLGQKVRTLVNETQRAGAHSVVLNAQGLPSGVYFARLEAGTQRAIQKMILMK